MLHNLVFLKKNVSVYQFIKFYHESTTEMKELLVEAPLTIFYYSKRQVYYSKRVVNEFCGVAGFFEVYCSKRCCSYIVALATAET